MKVSVIITTYKRPELLQHGLSSYLNDPSLNDIEFIVVNDGIEDDTENVCKSFEYKLNIKYYFTGQRNQNGTIWRCPGHAINYGVLKSNSDNVLISCAEMYYVKSDLISLVTALDEDRNRLIIPYGFDDDCSVLNNLPNLIGYKHLPLLNTKFPFFMLLDKVKFVNIGGYDEEFSGVAFDDNDIVDRFLDSGSYYYQHKSDAIHLYHSRNQENYSNEYQSKWNHNYSLYVSRRGIINRNTNKQWGNG